MALTGFVPLSAATAENPNRSKKQAEIGR